MSAAALLQTPQKNSLPYLAKAFWETNKSNAKAITQGRKGGSRETLGSKWGARSFSPNPYSEGRLDNGNHCRLA